MGDLRIDGSKTQDTDSSCDPDALVCGPSPAKVDPQPRDVEPWHAPMLPEEKPHVVAQIAKNMGAPRAPSDATLRAEYAKMPDAALFDAHAALEAEMSGGKASAEDKARLNALDRVLANRNAADADAKAEEAQAWRSPVHAQADGLGVQAGATGHDGKNMKLFDASAKLGAGHTGIQGTVMHLQAKHDFRFADVSVSGDALSAGYDQGVHNSDGSWGVHGGGGAVAAGGEITVHKQGVGSVTVGASEGASAEVSIGVKKEGKQVEGCLRASFAVATVGVCFPMIRL